LGKNKGVIVKCRFIYKKIDLKIIPRYPQMYTKVKYRKQFMVRKACPAGGNQGAEFWTLGISLNVQSTPPVSGALGVIGLSGRAS
jgi:hypothetical protein